MDLKKHILDIPDYPEKGILFRDITTLLKHPTAFRQTADMMMVKLGDLEVDKVAGIESRGFMYGAILAYRLGVGFVPIRKEGKLPRESVAANYSLEYGTACVEMHRDAVDKGERVLIMDDLIATGGTAEAAAKLVEELGGVVAGFVFIIELAALKGREKISNYRIESLIEY